jgi:replicative superfamily II helicase
MMQRNNDNNLRSIFGFLGIPDEVYSVYQSSFLSTQSRNTHKQEELKLFHWQRECLYSTSVLRGGNLVYCVPTGGGKTLVAELVILKTVLQLRKQAIYVMPYVSLVQEKEKYCALLNLLYFKI